MAENAAAGRTRADEFHSIAGAVQILAWSGMAGGSCWLGVLIGDACGARLGTCRKIDDSPGNRLSVVQLWAAGIVWTRVLVFPGPKAPDAVRRGVVSALCVCLSRLRPGLLEPRATGHFFAYRAGGFVVFVCHGRIGMVGRGLAISKAVELESSNPDADPALSGVGSGRHSARLALQRGGDGSHEFLPREMVAVGTYLLWRHPDLWVVSAAGAAQFGTFYFVYLFVFFRLWPAFPLYWDGPDLWGPTMASVPVDEIAWAVGFGAICPLLLAHVLDVQRRAPVDGFVEKAEFG